MRVQEDDTVCIRNEDTKMKGITQAPLSVVSVLNTINGGEDAGLILAAILELTNAVPELMTFVDEHLIPMTVAYFKRPLSQCLNDDSMNFLNQNMFSYFDLGDQIFIQPTVQTVLTGFMGVHGKPKMPMHIYKSVQDEIFAIADTDALVRKLCSQEAGLEYVRYLPRDHTLEGITGSGDAFTFLRIFESYRADSHRGRVSDP